LNFSVDIHSGETFNGQQVAFVRESAIVGEMMRVIGVVPVPGELTVLYSVKGEACWGLRLLEIGRDSRDSIRQPTGLRGMLEFVISEFFDR
jgi:hypothetical protein